jgi:hypothetical protein
MFHDNRYIFTGKTLNFRAGTSDSMIVDIAIYGPDFLYSLQLFQQFNITQVTGMPYFITG